ncbi:AAA family ATPase [Aliivibrio fischeri]|nr:AAA family ATPase [Aliivibrio fischeri]
MNQDNFIILTGGPSSGKTTVINALKARNFFCSEEAGRKIIRNQLEQKGDALPWANKQAFGNLVLRYGIASYLKHQSKNNIVFFDRSIVDVLAFFNLEKVKISDVLVSKITNFKYHSKVFIFPPWKDIFTNDNERREDFNVAINFYNEIIVAYEKSGYELVEVPFGTVDERVKFILAKLENS